MAAVLVWLYWRDRRGRHEQIHLWAGFALFADLEEHLERVAHGHCRVLREHFGVLVLVPVGGELVWAADRERLALEGQGLRWLEPGAEGLIGEVDPGAV